jgi:hypothetical protein
VGFGKNHFDAVGEAVRAEATKAETGGKRLDRSQQEEAGGRQQEARSQRQEDSSQKEESRNTEVNDGKDVKHEVK